ncbi:MAG TPA: helical backbone metal receptor [Flavisolibacter sp.]|nr:helical backbone metal receptor [Flavisolibacter sp.]
MHRTVDVPAVPKRIVSLVPSQTELLHHLGLEKEVIGITKFCVHPEKWFRQKQRIGGTKNVDTEKVAALQPDLIIANKEENVKEQIEELERNFPVWVSDVNTLQEAYAMMQNIGKITNRESAADNLVQQLRNNFSQLQTPNTKHQTAYLIWKDPYMTVGSDTFIHHLLEVAGMANLFAGRLRYPAITIDELQAANCQLLLLSSEPFPFRQKHVEELQQQLPSTTVLLVDGEMFSWYGSRLLQAPAYFRHLQHKIATLP